ncbi:MAG: peptide deformylase [Cardiobacteriaceae bacterium]|nr:peptide deformylase [Cardiobacteriaceae bacterium]
MEKYPILIHPHPHLRLTAKPVTDFSPRLAEIAGRMFATMYEARGIGLAATQVDIHERIVVLDVPTYQVDDNGVETDEVASSVKQVLINPEILSASAEKSVYQEGCLSLPGQYADVERPARIRYRYHTLDGNVVEDDADGLLAVCIQHEIDHLNGVLFIDHLSRLKRERLEKKLAKSLKQA